MSTTPPAPERVSTDSLDDLDETGEDVQNDKASTKKLYLLLAGIIALIFVALLTIALFVFPGFLTDNSDSAPAQQQQTTPLSDRTDQSGTFRVGDTLRVVSGGSLLNVHCCVAKPTRPLCQRAPGTVRRPTT